MRALLTLVQAIWQDARAYAPGRNWQQLSLLWLGAISLWACISLWAWRAGRTLGDASLITGYALFAAMLLLGAYNLRKRLSVLPLGPARLWMLTHGVLGVMCVPLYFQHTGSLWPGGLYERVLALLFYFVMLTGLAGYVLQRLLPRRLTDLDREVIYERIPSEIAELREQTEALIIRAMQELGSDTLGRYHAESLDWYFWKPRFLMSHLMGSGRAGRWIRGHITALRRYLSESERAYLDQVQALALRKSQLDAHLVLQGALKYWLFLHVPAALALLMVAAWHMLVVNIYGR